MAKKSMYLLAAFLLTFCFTLSCVFAQDKLEDLKEKLSGVRHEKAQIKSEYESELGKTNKTFDDRLYKIKADFHKVREECLGEKKSKCDQLKADYKKKIQPLTGEEKGILEAMGPGRGMNFAKSKAKK